MAEKNEAFEEKAATLVALTPESPDYAGETVSNNEIPFPVLTDTNLQVSALYGLVFDLTIIAQLYESFAELSIRQGEDIQEKLPLTATYVIDQEGSIRYAFLETDYRKRAEPAEILQVLAKLTAQE